MKKILYEAIVIVLLLIGLTLAQRVGHSQDEGSTRGPSSIEERPIEASSIEERPLENSQTSLEGQTTSVASLTDLASGQDNTIKIDPNLASLEELQDLPCIGPALAKRIVDYRNMGHNIKCAEDLLPISGIGPKTIEKMRPYLRFP